MSDLIKAFQIFLKYGDPYYPSHCEHDIMYVMIESDIVSEEDIELLNKLSFHPNDDGYFQSYRFGSA